MEKLLIHTVPAILSGFIIQTILHEIGHLIGGLLTGWRLLYLQLYSLVLKKKDKGYTLTVVSNKGFMCIMYPDSVNNKALIYTMGGCIANLLSGIIGVQLLYTVAKESVLWLYIWCFMVFGIGLFLMNGIARVNRVCNDMACYILLKNDSNSRFCHNSQLLIAKELMRGLSYGDIGRELICLCPDPAENDIQAYQAVLEYYYYLDIRDYLKMGQALNKIRKKDNISKEVSNIIELEHMYLQLLIEYKLLNSSNSNPSIDMLRENINKYSKKGDIHSLRIKAVFEAYVQLRDGNIKIATDILKKAIENIKGYKCIYEGERIFCISQLMNILYENIS